MVDFPNPLCPTNAVDFPASMLIEKSSKTMMSGLVGLRREGGDSAEVGSTASAATTCYFRLGPSWNHGLLGHVLEKDALQVEADDHEREGKVVWKENGGGRHREPKEEQWVISIYFHAFRWIDKLLMGLGFIGSLGDGLSITAMLLFTSKIINSIGSASATDISSHNVNKGYCWTRTGERQASRMRSRYLKAVLRQEVGYFDLHVTSTAEIIANVSSDSLVIQDVISEKASNCGVSFCDISCNPWLMYGRALMGIARKMRVEYNKAGTVAVQALSSIKTVYAFVAESKTIENYSLALQGTMELGLRQGLAKGLAMGSNGIVFVIWSFMAYYGSRLIMYHNASGGHVFVVGASITWGGLYVTRCWLTNLKNFSEASAAGERILEIIKRVPKIDSDNMDGELVGGGVRKINVIALLQRFYDPWGEICLDGVAIDKLQLKWLRSQMGLVSQEPALFATSIKENILFGKEDGRISNVRGTEATNAIARALIKAPRILLLDEATSALDSESERVVQEALDNAAVGRTTIVIAHRLSTIRNADIIAVVQNGQDHNEIKYKMRIYSLCFVCLAILSLLINVLQHYNFAYMGEHLTKRIRVTMLSKILAFEVGWFDREENTSGAVCSRLANDANVEPKQRGFRVENELAMWQTWTMTNDLAKGSDSVKSVFAVLDRYMRIEPNDPEGYNPDNITGHVELCDVQFAYPARPEVMDFNVFSINIEAGKSTALVGESGSGKSTIVGLIERFYDPLKGVVKIDGHDIRLYHLRSLRKYIALVSQEPTLFAGSIRDNITYSALGKIDESEVIEVAKAANAHDFIVCLKDGYDTWCGDRGLQLSGGQKQRIEIAHAILKNPAILLLDEVTSALDSQSEQVVQDALERVMDQLFRGAVMN
ncbi:hypothetical protein C3L33_01559, partial [Rhododendron williamsianum]